MNWCTFCQTYHTASSCYHPANPSGHLNPDPSYVAQWQPIAYPVGVPVASDELIALRSEVNRLRSLVSSGCERVQDSTDALENYSEELTFLRQLRDALLEFERAVEADEHPDLDPIIEKARELK